MTLLSIITINYNNCLGLKNTINSVIPIKNDDIEYLVIDGASTDNSQSIINENKEYIDYHISEPDEGIYNAMNKGIRKASGEYVVFLNSGDIISKKVNLASFINATHNDDIIYFNLEISDRKTFFIKRYPSTLDFKYFCSDALPHVGTIIKKELLIKYGLYNENYKIVADWSFFMDVVLKYNCSYRHVDTNFATFYSDGISTSNDNFTAMFEERSRHIKEAYPLYFSLYEEWKEKSNELYLLKSSNSVRWIKKLGLLKWLKL